MKICRILLSAMLTGCVGAAFAAPIRHNYDLKNVLWKLSISMERGTISGEVTNSVILREPSESVQFHCSQLVVSRVTVNGRPANFKTNDDKLTVNLGLQIPAGKKLDVRAIYSGKPTTGLYFVPASRAFPAHTGMIYTQGQGEDNHFWVPTYDYPDDKATTECFVTVPNTWTAISNGKLLGVMPEGKDRVFHYKMDQPYSTYLISLVAGPYVKHQDQWHGIPVEYYVPPGLEKQGKASFGDTPKMIDLFSEITGFDYPYAKFAQEVVGDFMFGGMENVTCVTQTIRTLHAAGTEPVNDSTYLVAHELAHHWFGDLITCRTWEHSWLNEGFATTLPLFYTRATRGQDAFDLERYNNLEGAVDSIGSRGRSDVVGTAGSLPSINMGSVYAGGSSRIMMLYQMMGEKTFWNGISRFLKKYQFQPVTTREFFDVMEATSTLNLEPFLKQWYYTSSTPSLTATVSEGSLVVTQLQPYYKLELPVWIRSGKQWTKKTLDLQGQSSSLALGDLAGKPLLIDPEAWIPMELHYAIPYSDQDVLELYRNAPNAAQKARIIAGMFDSISLGQRIAIGHSEKIPGLLQMVASHIGQEGVSYLFELSHSSDAKVVNAAVAALETLKQSDNVLQRLREISKASPNEAIREHAMQGLLNWNTDAKFAQSVWGMKAFDDGYRKMALEWWGTSNADEARARCLAILKNPDSEPLRVTAIQVLGRVKEKEGEHKVFAALASVAMETSYAARIAAINSLAQLGDKSVTPLLKSIIGHAPGGVQGTAQAAIDHLAKL